MRISDERQLRPFQMRARVSFCSRVASGPDEDVWVRTRSSNSSRWVFSHLVRRYSSMR